MLPDDPSRAAAESVRPARLRRVAREQATRERVLDAAEAEFAVTGFDEARIHSIADRASVALGTLYGVYPSKLDLYVAVHERRLSALFTSVAASMLDQERAFDAIRVSMLALVRFFCGHPDYLAMHLRDGHAWSTRAHLRTEVQRASWDRGMELMQALFARSASEGDMRAGRPDRDARVAIAIHQVCMADWLESANRSTPEELFATTWELIERTFVASTTKPKETKR